MLITEPIPIIHHHEKQIRTADWTSNMQRSVLREMLAVVSKPGILSFAGGLPDPEMFPTREFARATQHVLNNDRYALQYGPPFEPLKEHITVLMEERGVSCTPEQIFITTGAQQALNVISSLLMNNSDSVMIERTIYSGIQQVIAPYKPHIIDLESSLDTGVNIGMIEQHLLKGQTAAFLYLVPDSHNPLGVTINADRRKKLAELAQTHQLPIIEDDPYGLLRYDGEYIPALRAFNDEWIFYVGSFSKILAPALRLGWMVVPEALRDKLTVIKESYDLETSAFIQRAVSAFLDAGYLPKHLHRLRTAYMKRRDAMLETLAREFPVKARWSRPLGGMFIWVELPEEIDSTSLLLQAVEEEKVAFIPGSAFEVSSSSAAAANGTWADRCMRLNFTNCSPELIEEGIGRLGNLLHRQI